MSSQQARRRSPYPWTWELPAAIAAALVAVLVIGVQVGRAAANLTAGGGWHLPPALTGWSTSTLGVLAGDPAAGLTPPPDHLATTNALWVWVAAVEVALLAATTITGVWVYRRWGPGRMVGMASRTEAEHILGVSRLRRNRTLIRPDLYEGKRR